MISQKQPDLQVAIQGIERILPPNGHINMYRDDDMVIAINGSPGTGKTLLSLQMAFGIAANNSKAIFYLTKDTSAQSLLQKSVIKFDSFGHLQFAKLPGFKNKKPTEIFIDSNKDLPDHLVETYVKALIEGIQEKSLGNKTNQCLSMFNKIIKFLKPSSNKGEILREVIIDLIPLLLKDKKSAIQIWRDFFNDPKCLPDDVISILFELLVSDLSNSDEATIRNLIGKYNTIIPVIQIVQKNKKEFIIDNNLDNKRNEIQTTIIKIFGQEKSPFVNFVATIPDQWLLNDSTFELLNNDLAEGDIDKAKGYLTRYHKIFDNLKLFAESKIIIRIARHILIKSLQFNPLESDFEKPHCDFLLGNGLLNWLEMKNKKSNIEEVPKMIILENISDKFEKIERSLECNSIPDLFEKSWKDLDNEFRLLFAEEIGHKFNCEGANVLIANCLEIRPKEQDRQNRQCWKIDLEDIKEKTGKIIEKIDKDRITDFRDLLFDILMTDALDARGGSFIAFGDLNPGTFVGKPADRFSSPSDLASNSPISSLYPLSPLLAPLFSWLKRDRCSKMDNKDKNEKYEKMENEIGEFQNKINGIRDFWNNQLMVVCDSVTPPILDECVQIHRSEGTKSANVERGATDDMNFTKPTWLFIIESEDMPISATAAYAPDVQINLKAEVLPHNICRRTIQIKKARHQEVVNEPLPFLIISADDEDSGQMIVQLNVDSSEEPIKSKRSPGIYILPSISQFGVPFCKNIKKHDNKEVAFGKEIDEKLFKNHNIPCGNCTLVVSENRCRSTVLGLHYLMASLEDSRNSPSQNDIQNDVLFISFDTDLNFIVQMICTYEKLRNKVEKDKLKGLTSNQTEETILKTRQIESRHTGHFFKIKISNKSNFIIYAPQLEWKITEEILDDIEWIIKESDKGNYTRNIKRILFSKVGRIQSCWPLMDNPRIFVSGIAKLSKNYGISLMIIDDTADQSSHTGHIASDFYSLASIIIRLKRVSIRGTQTVALEVTRASGCEINYQRPVELFKEPFDKDLWNLKIRDTFRGYSSIFADDPKHCKIRLDLPYDRDNSPLHSEVKQIEYNLGLLFDEIEVRSLGPSKVLGINATLAHLANLTHDTCHVCAVDEIWLSSLLNSDDSIGNQKSSNDNEPALAELRGADLNRILPKRLVDKYIVNNKNDIDLNLASKLFVTQALTFAQKTRRIKSSGKYPYAIPYYHNWGIFSVFQPQKDLMARFWNQLEQTIKPDVKGSVVKEIKTFLCGSNQKAQSLVYQLLWDLTENIEKPASWNDMLNFKDKWDKVFSPKTVKEINVFLKKDDDLRLYFPNGFNINFFSICCESQESVVCFFLELLLSIMEIKDLFEKTSGSKYSKSLYKIRNSSKVVSGFIKAINIIQTLLCEEDRKKIAGGKWSIKISQNKKDKKEDQENKSEDRQDKIPEKTATAALFSREWTTSIPELNIENDWRNGVVLKHLPVWTGEDGKKDNRLWDMITFNSESKKEDVALKNECKSKGPTVSGTWYLGVLRGGNIDLAADIIGELTSEIREIERVINQKAAGVFKESYTNPKSTASSNGESGLSPFPYSSLIRLCHCEPNNKIDESKYDFPFSRVLIYNYPTVSIEFYNFIRQCMKMPRNLNPSDEQKNAVKSLVEKSLKKIERFQSVE